MPTLWKWSTGENKLSSVRSRDGYLVPERLWLEDKVSAPSPASRASVALSRGLLQATQSAATTDSGRDRGHAAHRSLQSDADATTNVALSVRVYLVILAISTVQYTCVFSTALSSLPS